MQDVLTTARQLRRPRLLVQTARHGIEDYRRGIHLRRLLGCELAPGPAQALIGLLELERGVNEARKARDAAYKVARHVEILIAIMAETRLIEQSAQRRAAPQELEPVR